MTDTPIVNQLVLLLSFKNDFMFELLLVFTAPYITINKIVMAKTIQSKITILHQ